MIATHSPSERQRAGVALRQKVPRSAQGEWTRPAERADPTNLLIEQGKSRIQELLPIRYARMSADPFAFLRGAAAVMAADLAHTPTTGIRLQACGDAHLANFGSYATPEGSPVFDVNDFDETLPAPFEWDLKRLATSLVVAGRVAQYSGKAARDLARLTARSYREQMAKLACLPPVEAGIAGSTSFAQSRVLTSRRYVTPSRSTWPRCWKVGPSTSAWLRRRTVRLTFARSHLWFTI
jgi:hypothetical protein